MNAKIPVVLGVGLLIVSRLHAGVIPITDASFEGKTGTIAGPSIIGTTSGSIGAWSASASTAVALGASSIASGNSLGGPTPSAGTYDVRISMPSLGLADKVTLSQVLTATSFAANSTYTLSVDLDQGTASGLFGSGSVLQLRAGSTALATLALSGRLDSTAGFQTVSLTYNTGGTAPTGNIGIYLEDDAAINLGGNVYLDKFQLTQISAVPEAKTGAAAAVFLLLVIWREKRRKHPDRDSEKS